MSVKEIPSNTNALSPLLHRFVLSRLPNTTFFCQRVVMPNVSLQNSSTATPFISLPYAGTEMDFGNLQLQFLVDEDMKNYKELLEWIEGLAFPENFGQYATLKANVDGNKGIESDATLLITTSSKNPNIEVTFIDIFPIALTDLVFDVTKQDVDYLTATVAFAHRRFKVNMI